MWGSDPDIARALGVLGLGPEASMPDAKSAFRQIAKRLHPDHTPPTAKTLSRLAEAIHAIRTLEKSDSLEVELALSPGDARDGVTRTVTRRGRSGVFRILPDTASGARIAAIGDPAFTIVIRIEAQTQTSAPTTEAGLNRFVDDFVKGSPTARLAGWLRKARSAA